MTARSRTRESYRFYARSYDYRSKPKDMDWTQIKTSTNYGYKQRNRYESMQDSISSPPYPDQNLTHVKFVSQAPVVTGTCVRISNYGDIHQYMHGQTPAYDASYGSASLGHLGLSLPASPYDYINTALRKNNPGNPEIDLHAFIYELRELPSLFKTLFRDSVTGLPIAYTFGIRPLVNDIRKILDLTDSIAARMEQLEKLTRGPVKERLSLGNETRSSSYMQNASAIHGFVVQIERTTRRRAWCVKDSVINRNRFTPPTKPDTRFMRRLLLTDNPLVTLWQVMPWSWLIDYFVDVQSFLGAFGGNRINGYQVLSLCVCVETRTDGLFKLGGRQDRWAGGKFIPGKWMLLDQLRRIYLEPKPVLPGLTPILTGNQLMTLSQLTLALSGHRNEIARRN